MDVTQTIWIPLLFGLIGFVEPCSIGIHMMFLGSVVDASAARRGAAMAVFAVVRASLMVAVGISAAWLGAGMFRWQGGWFLFLGAAYVAIGVWLAVGGRVGALMRVPWFSGAWLTDVVRGSPLLLGLLGGLTIPACAIPLVAVLVGQSAVVGDVVWGGVSLLVFGLALTLPLLPLVWGRRGPALLGYVAGVARRYRLVLAIVLVLVGILTALSGQWWSAAG